MANEYTPYVTFDQQGISRVGCMKCDKTVATRREPSNQVVHMTHSKRYPVKLEDGSTASLIVCDECLPTISDGDLPLLEKTMKWGHRRELEWKFTESQLSFDKTAFKNYKAAFSIRDGEPTIPLRVSKLLLEGKAILGRE